ncbi:hypothetical protein [Nonomuraea recticatena]|uniref:hypothetical protein n=1 Tax=Nonomuraea recticatena TaxID=46178 RepID=UPI0031FA09DE
MSVLHLDHVEALWLLAAPELAIAWAAAYDRAYPGALLELELRRGRGRTVRPG